MPSPAMAGVLVYAKDVERVSRFYERVLGATVVAADAEHRVLQAPQAQLLIHAIPAAYADPISITVPPVPREAQAFKPFFTVPSLEKAEAAAVEAGGVVHGTVWPGPGLRVRNIADPEGNIIHVRQPVG